VTIGKKSLRILHNLLDMEPRARVRLAIRSLDTRNKRPRQAAVRDATLIWANRVGEGEAWRTGGAARGFVDVRCCLRGRGVGAGYAGEGDVLFILIRQS
jgi:hypothetical protein